MRPYKLPRSTELQKATDTVKRLTEKYLLLVCDRTCNLQEEMKSRKLRKDWDKLFLQTWATEEILALPLGDMGPPDK